MKTAPIVPARWSLDAEGRVFAPDFGDVYHPRAGALDQARHVFLQGNGLPARWRGRHSFVVLETGFGLGNNFLATWDAWRRDEQRCVHLHFISVERHPLARADLCQLHAKSPLRPLADALIAAWPPLTPNLHRLDFDAGRVHLSLALGDAAAWLPELVAQVDAFYLDGFAPGKNADMWHPPLLKALARLAAPAATLATWTAAREVRAGLGAAGFDVRLAAGSGGKRDITLADFAPRFRARRAAPTRQQAPSSELRAVIVGAGLAGCASAWALAEQGWHSTVIDRHASSAMEASGNPAGLFHGVFHRSDGAHARFNRAAALALRPVVQRAIAEHGVAGSADGLLRLETVATDVAEMRGRLAQLGLPADYVQALSAEQTAARCGLPLPHPAWFFPGGGWVDPGGLARALLARAGAATSFVGRGAVHALRRSASGWELLDATGKCLDAAHTVVLANAFDALRLLGSPGWPVTKVRGQISLWHGQGLPGQARLPVTGAGYLLPQHRGEVIFGATSQRDDDDISVRASDHLHNLAQLARLLGKPVDHIRPEALRGRTAWRMVTGDRLPIIGAVPDPAGQVGQGPRAFDRLRSVPRLPGLFVFTALGSRGITWSALGAQVLASAVSGAPQVLEASLLDAVDPARFELRAFRRAQAIR